MSETETSPRFPSSAVADFLVFRVETRSNHYHAAIGIVSGRLLACLRGASCGHVIREADGAPLIGDRSLFDTPPAEWIDLPLRIGATVTSAVSSVVAETDATTIRDLVASFTEGTAVEPHRRAVPATVAQRVVQHAEVAAWCLRRLEDNADDVPAALADTEARMRLQNALEECGALVRRLVRGM